METIIKIENLVKKYNDRTILNKITYNFTGGKFYAILGPSGTGKTTLMDILNLNKKFDEGSLIIMDKTIKSSSDNDKNIIRQKIIGRIYQDYKLNDSLTILENTFIPLLATNTELEKAHKIAEQCLYKVGMIERKNEFPITLSGGEKQRVAIARAMITNPKIILADEPTGNLDVENSQNVFRLLRNLSEKGCCVIVVSHSDLVLSYADEILTLKDGVLK